MLTAAQLLGAAKAKVDHFRSLLTDAMTNGILVTAWGKGAPTVEIYDGVSGALALLSTSVSLIANQGFISTAIGSAKTLNAKQVYGVSRPGATYATTTVLCTNASGGNYPYSPNNPLLFLNTPAQKQYRSQGSGVIGPLAADVPVDVIALEPGSASSALPGDIDTLVTALDGVTVSQPTAAVGQDEMSDAVLEAACLARVGYVPTQSTIGAGGAKGAQESVARAGADGGGGVLRPDGTRVAVTRVRVLQGTVGSPRVVVADADGPLTTDDLALVRAAIFMYATPNGVGSPVVDNATTLAIATAYTIYVPASSGVTDDDLKAAAEQALVDYFAAVPIGGYLLVPPDYVIPIDGIRGAIRRAVTALVGDLGTVTVKMTTPSADVTVSAETDVPTLLGTPTVTIVRVPGV